MKPWYDIYKERMNEEYKDHIKRKYAGFLDQIMQSFDGFMFRDSLTIGEMGCGAANISRVLSEKMSDMTSFILVDNCPKMMSLAMENMTDTKSIFLNKSILDDEFDYGISFDMEGVFNIIHSHGVLEHFTDSEIREIIRIQKNCCNGPLLHYVPSNKYKTPSRGDERLMTPAQWQEICNPDEIIELNNGFDLVLKWEKK